MKQLRGIYASVDITATSFADNIKLRLLCVYKQNHNNAELLNCLFKKIVTFMA
jgi:hypothetical protein